MARVFLSLGSNIERQRHIVAALDALAAEFGELALSPVYESEAVGFVGDNFFNLVVAISTELAVDQLSAGLKAIEDANGRDRSGPKFSGRTLDIDILTYGDAVGVIDGVELPRDEILTNAFVLRPLADLAGSEKHPQLQQSYDELWRSYREAQQLWSVDFSWRGRQFSHA